MHDSILNSLGDVHTYTFEGNSQMNGRCLCTIDIMKETTLADITNLINSSARLYTSNYLNVAHMAAKEVIGLPRDLFHNIYITYGFMNIIQFRNKDMLDILDNADKEVRAEVNEKQPQLTVLHRLNLIPREGTWLPTVQHNIMNRQYTISPIKKKSLWSRLPMGEIITACCVIFVVGMIIRKSESLPNSDPMVGIYDY